MGSHIALATVMVVFLLTSAARAADGCVAQARAAFDARYSTLYGPQASFEQAKSLEVIEQESLTWIANCVHCPQKPFGNANGKWMQFKQAARPGDCLVRFSTNPESWERLAGRQGYALVRQGQIVRTFVLLRN